MFIKNFIKKQVTLAIITFLMLGVVVFGSSYALFQKTFVDEKTQSISIGDLNIVFSNGKKENGEYVELDDSNAINLTNVLPMSDEDAIADDDNIYNFVIYNSGTIPYSYTISLVDNEEETNTISHNYLRYKLDYQLSNNTYMNNGTPWILGDKTNDIIYEYIINPGETHSFKLKTWLAEAEKYNLPNEVLGGEAHLNIIIDGEATSTRAPKGWQYAKEGTLLAGIKQNEPVVHSDSEDGMTVPGREVSSTDEGLRETIDDYGTTYYYRGAVEDNYVIFARKCWRIVRITGNGAIKLILHNNDAPECDISDNTLHLAKYDGKNYTTAFNNATGLLGKATGVGFMYGDKDATTYLEAQANTTDSTILTNLKAWYDYINTESVPTFTEEEKNSLADVIWCGDKSLATGVGWGSTYTTFGAVKRLVDKTTAAPSLVCPDIEGNTKLSKYTASSTTDGGYGNGLLNGYKIGLLTADEAAFAGSVKKGTAEEANADSYYLYDGYYWYTMSPYYFDIYEYTRAGVWFVRSSGHETDGYVNTKRSLRPTIALKPDVTYTLNNGTENPGSKTNPFVIN